MLLLNLSMSLATSRWSREVVFGTGLEKKFHGRILKYKYSLCLVGSIVSASPSKLEVPAGV